MRKIAVSQRPRERLVAIGAAALSDAELVAILLGNGREELSAVDLGLELLAATGGVAELARLPVDALTEVSGIGIAKATRVVASFELARRAEAPTERIQLTTTTVIAKMAAQALRHARRETVLVLVADQQNGLLRTDVVASGAVDSVAFPVREVLAAVLRADGRAFAVAHNHPSGDPAPSVSDRNASRVLAQAADAVGVRFLDHVVVADRGWASAT